MFCILWCLSGLSVENVLFMIISDGFMVSVWVRLMCCCMLFDSLDGSLCENGVRLICLSIFIVWCLCFFLFMFVILSLNVVFDMMV